MCSHSSLRYVITSLRFCWTYLLSLQFFAFNFQEFLWIAFSSLLLSLQIVIALPLFATDGATWHAIPDYGCAWKGPLKTQVSLEFFQIFRMQSLLQGWWTEFPTRSRECVLLIEFCLCWRPGDTILISPGGDHVASNIQIEKPLCLVSWSNN